MKGINHHIIDYKNIQKNKVFDISLVREALPLYFEEKDVEVARLYGGFCNTSAFVSKEGSAFVLRLYTNKGKKEQYKDAFGKIIKAEWAFIKYLDEKGIPVPHLFPNRNGELISKYKDIYIVLMSYVDGTDGRYELNDRKFRNLGVLMAKMHTFSQDYSIEHAQILGTDNPFEHLKRKIKPNTSFLYKDFLEIYNEYKKQLPKINKLPKYLIHGDLIFSNILFDNDAIAGVLDFDDIHRGVFIKELATLAISAYDHHGLYDVPLEYVDSFISGYVDIRPLSKLEKDLLPLYLKLSQLGVKRMLTKYRPKLVKQYLYNTDAAIKLITEQYLGL